LSHVSYNIYRYSIKNPKKSLLQLCTEGEQEDAHYIHINHRLYGQHEFFLTAVVLRSLATVKDSLKPQPYLLRLWKAFAYDMNMQERQKQEASIDNLFMQRCEPTMFHIYLQAMRENNFKHIGLPKDEVSKSTEQYINLLNNTYILNFK
jgi:hypothetical protein